jgi:hypothetical protein
VSKINQKLTPSRTLLTKRTLLRPHQDPSGELTGQIVAKPANTTAMPDKIRLHFI